MRKRNKENIGLPTRWQYYHGAYYYKVKPGLEHLWDGKKRFRLGKTLTEAYKTWSTRLCEIDCIRNVGQLLDRYALETVPSKAANTQKDNIRSIKLLKSVFGCMLITQIKPMHIYQYIDKREAKVSAKREIAVFSHAYTKAIEWGLIDRHPFKGQIRLKSESPRDRYIEDWEIVEALSLTCRRKRGSVSTIQAYIRLKLLTGLRRGDLLRLQISDLKDDGIHVQPQKTVKSTKKKLIIGWTDDLRHAIQSAIDTRPLDIGPWIFCTKFGKCYVDKDGTASGWNSMWQRFMKRVLEETKVTERFTEHDLRAKCASDAESLEHARQLLAHADSRLTDRVYRRKPELVKPAKGIKER